MNERILVWDLPLRVFHWVLAASFAGAFLTAESERLRDLHLLCGYTFAGAIAFRVAWGFVGSRHARFSSLRFGPVALARYLRSLAAGRPEPHAGHGPVAIVMIPLLLGLGLAVAASGLATYAEWGGEWLEEAHEAAAFAMLAVVIAHVAGVVVLSVLQRENLALALVTGRKRGAAGDAIRGSRPLVALLLLAALAGLWLPGLAAREHRHAARGAHVAAHGVESRDHAD
ncbi:MAG: cytochrome b/b6 domain-containing protein [Deltaproteobacteria bacterium]|nr:cytochrome b/b6 domain-containing protein [Deltaproteobacteria bacterium]